MAKKSNAKRIERLEQIIMGAGFLLSCVKSKYGNSMGEGFYVQISQCIKDCDQVTGNAEQRKARGGKA